MPNKKRPSKQKGKLKFLGDEEEPKSLRNNTVHPTCVIAGEDIVEHAVIGEGFYATVKVGSWTRHDKKEEKVAIKCIKEEVVRDHLGEILTEANNMVKLEHDNVIKLYGICLVTRENEQCKVKLVTEYAPFGPLVAVIQDKDEEQRRFFCQVTKLLEFASQIAKGMQYLHSKNLIHFDLAARNVLVVAPNKVRISDFGLARVLCQDEKKILLEKPIAVAWCAPELFKNQLATKGCDVWSYGVLLWELLSFGEKPWKDLSIEQVRRHYTSYKATYFFIFEDQGGHVGAI
ncbi:activated CDC42 kinase 1-like [Actinia tenebrosa]|uniref:Activated CDC42 kinase 1-like n=1 Tax=Actinia tenebrosa TaxID=6105 RepID=A0A6P8IXD2_ACTTE|nr:activated CDC42 kinase 1-like [Actinia tenebrosa]